MISSPICVRNPRTGAHHALPSCPRSFGFAAPSSGVGDDPYALITNQPVAHSPDCLIELAFNFDAVHADLHTVGTLGGVAANMADNADELRVIHYLDLAAWGFIEKLKYHQLLLNSVVSKCTEAGCTL